MENWSLSGALWRTIRVAVVVAAGRQDGTQLRVHIVGVIEHPVVLVADEGCRNAQAEDGLPDVHQGPPQGALHEAHLGQLECQEDGPQQNDLSQLRPYRSSSA